MKTSLPDDTIVIREMLQEHWDIAITQIHFIPIGDSAYSYRVQSKEQRYYLKIVD